MMMTAVEIANEVRMRTLTHSGPFLLIEGDSDAKFFAHQFGEEAIALIPSFGWENVVQAIEILEGEQRRDVLGIIDLDYRGIIDDPPPSKNIVMTDTHSIETMMFASSAFYRVMKERASHEKVKNFPEGMNGIRKRVIELGKPIGSLRFYSYKAGGCYSFDGMNLEKFVDKKTLSFSGGKFVAHLRGIHPKNTTISENIFQNAMTEAQYIEVFQNPYRLCCGHDLMEILAIGLKKIWGTHGSKEISGAFIEELFRLAYSKEEFRTSRLYSDIEAWFRGRDFPISE